MLLIKYYLLFLVLIGNILCITSYVQNQSTDINRFRNDYTYDARAEGWFKVHPIPVDWQTARLICHFEGAELASPLNAGMLESIKELVANHKPKLATYFSGVHQTFGNGIYTSIEGIPLEKLHIPNWHNGEPKIYERNQHLIVYTNDGTVWDNKIDDYYPYICYRKYSKNDKLTECGTIDQSYILDNRTGSCYKVHNHAMVWEQAHQICQAEGAYLAVINSKTEAEVLTDIYVTQPYLGHRVAIGYRAWGQNGIWWTVHGQTLEEAGFEMWGDNSLDEKPYAGTVTESCGSFNNRGLQAISCNKPLNFICEKSVESLTN